MVAYLWALAALSGVLGAPTTTGGSSPTSVQATASSAAASSSNSTASCVNSASDRSCWGDYDISTNYYDVVPDTGVTREYWFNIENTTAAPDGIERIVLAINGSIPGPTIIADWGDEIIVHITNNMQNNGSTIHWHGIRQNYTNVCFQPNLFPCSAAFGRCDEQYANIGLLLVYGRRPFSDPVPHCS